MVAASLLNVVSVRLIMKMFSWPNEAFNEVLKDNIVLVRRRAHDVNLKILILKIGAHTKTTIAVLYVAHLVKPGLVAEVERRLSMIKVDKVLGMGLIEEFLIDHPWSPFPQTQVTERPDKMLAALYEGRVALIVDGTPGCAIVPCTYNVLMQTFDDYNIQPIIASSIRLLRGYRRLWPFICQPSMLPSYHIILACCQRTWRFR